MTPSPLDSFRNRFAGCELVLLADIAAGTVLTWEAAVKWPQEQLDAICAEAVRILGLQAGPGDAPTDTAVLARPTATTVFIRAAPGAQEALCAVFAPGADISGVFDAGRDLCTEILGADLPVRSHHVS